MKVVLLFDGRGGLTERLAQVIAEGIRVVSDADLLYRPLGEAESSDPGEADALTLRSPNWSGITGRLEEWMDHNGDLLETRELVD
jgi:hypothetical protein